MQEEGTDGLEQTRRLLRGIHNIRLHQSASLNFYFAFIGNFYAAHCGSHHLFYGQASGGAHGGGDGWGSTSPAAQDPVSDAAVNMEAAAPLCLLIP